MTSAELHRWTSSKGLWKSSRPSRAETRACWWARNKITRRLSSAEIAVLPNRLTAASPPSSPMSWELVKPPSPNQSRPFVNQLGSADAWTPETITAATAPTRAMPARSSRPRLICAPAARASSRRCRVGRSSRAVLTAGIGTNRPLPKGLNPSTGSVDVNAGTLRGRLERQSGSSRRYAGYPPLVEQESGPATATRK